MFRAQIACRLHHQPLPTIDSFRQHIDPTTDLAVLHHHHRSGVDTSHRSGTAHNNRRSSSRDGGAGGGLRGLEDGGGGSVRKWDASTTAAIRAQLAYEAAQERLTRV